MTSTAVPPTSESLVTFIWLFWYLHGTLLTVKAVNWGGIIRSWQRSALRWLLSLLTFKSPYAALILLYTSHLDYPQIYKSVLLYFRTQWVCGKVAWISKLNQHLRQSAGVWPGSNICINKSPNVTFPSWEDFQLQRKFLNENVDFFGAAFWKYWALEMWLRKVTFWFSIHLTA